MGGKEEKRRRREQQREEEVVDTLQKLSFLESQGVEPVVTKDGRFWTSVEGAVSPEEVFERTGTVRDYFDDLFEMHKSDPARGIILEAWERFQEKER